MILACVAVVRSVLDCAWLLCELVDNLQIILSPMDPIAFAIVALYDAILGANDGA